MGRRWCSRRRSDRSARPGVLAGWTAINRVRSAFAASDTVRRARWSSPLVAGLVSRISMPWCEVTTQPFHARGASGADDGRGSAGGCGYARGGAWGRRAPSRPARGPLLTGLRCGWNSAACASAAARRRAGQGSEVIYSHELTGQGQLPPCGRGGYQPPDAHGAVRKQPLRAAVAMPRLRHALDFVHRLRSEVADIQELHYGSGGSAAVRLCHWPARRGDRGEHAGVNQTACVQGQIPAQPVQRGGFGRSVASGTDWGVSQAAPGSAIAGRMGDTRADVPTVGGGHLGRGHFPGVQADGPRKAAVVPLDRVAALSAAITLSAAEEPTGAVVLDTQ